MYAVGVNGSNDVAVPAKHRRTWYWVPYLPEMTPCRHGQLDLAACSPEKRPVCFWRDACLCVHIVPAKLTLLLSSAVEWHRMPAVRRWRELQTPEAPNELQQPLPRRRVGSVSNGAARPCRALTVGRIRASQGPLQRRLQHLAVLLVARRCSLPRSLPRQSR